MSFDTTPLGRAIRDAVESGEETAMASARSRLLELYADNRMPIDHVVQAVALAQGQRQWPTVVALAEAVMSHEDPEAVPAVVRRRYAQALIERGALSGAECVLNGIVAGEPPDSVEAGEAAGLLGRVAKQRYVDYHNTTQLRRAIEGYAAASKLPEVDRVWVGGNLLALLHRAQRDDVPVPAGVPRPSEVRDLVAAELDRTDPDLHTVWQRGTNVELLLATGDEDRAFAVARSLVDVAGTEPFELASLRRQLAQIWELPAEHRIMVALAAGEMGAGAGAELDVPEVDSLEKILSSELPVPYDSLVQGLTRARSVCKIVDRFDNALGTGFAIPGSQLSPSWGDELVIVTNAHVIPDALPADLAQAVFSKLADSATQAGQETLADDGSELAPTVEHLRVMWSSPVPEFDATVLAFDNSVIPVIRETISVSSVAPDLRDTDPFVYVVGHPRGRPLALSIRGNELLDVNDTKLHYMAPTEPGSSGSPVFDKQWNLIGLHHSGSTSMPRLDGSGERYAANEAINIRAIVNRLADGATGGTSSGPDGAGSDGALKVTIVGAEAAVVADLQAALEVEREALEVTTDDSLESLDPITVISFVISGVEMAHKVWTWWRSRREVNSDVKLIRPDGTEVHFSDLGEEELLALVDRVLRD